MSSTNTINSVTETVSQQSEFHQELAQLLKNQKFSNAFNDIIETSKATIKHPNVGEDLKICVVLFGQQICVDLPLG